MEWAVKDSSLPFFQLVSEKQASRGRSYSVLALKNLLDGG
ncbi:MAG: hypothetical protein RLZZ440_809 [Planctomycetota bacterium]|jgi:hypothetical protein